MSSGKCGNCGMPNVPGPRALLDAHLLKRLTNDSLRRCTLAHLHCRLLDLMVALLCWKILRNARFPILVDAVDHDLLGFCEFGVRLSRVRGGAPSPWARIDSGCFRAGGRFLGSKLTSLEDLALERVPIGLA